MDPLIVFEVAAQHGAAGNGGDDEDIDGTDLDRTAMIAWRFLPTRGASAFNAAIIGARESQRPQSDVDTGLTAWRRAPVHFAHSVHHDFVIPVALELQTRQAKKSSTGNTRTTSAGVSL